MVRTPSLSFRAFEGLNGKTCTKSSSFWQTIVLIGGVRLSLRAWDAGEVGGTGQRGESSLSEQRLSFRRSTQPTGVSWAGVHPQRESEPEDTPPACPSVTQVDVAGTGSELETGL